MSNSDEAMTQSSPDAEHGDKKRFAHNRLPDAAKVAILENIHDAQDKYNVLTMLPQLTMNELGYDITNWDDNLIRFELVYPSVLLYLQWPYEMEDRSWKTLLNLCKVSPEFQRIVTSYFEKHITWTLDSVNQYFQQERFRSLWTSDPLPDILAAASDSSSPPWHTKLPFGICTNLPKRTQVPFLTELGSKVWSLGISLMGGYPDEGSIDYLVECLRLVPDLRRLNLADFYPPEFSLYDLPPEVLDEERLVLPELPHLKMISLQRDCTKVQQWILPRYTRQLEVMEFRDCYLTDNFSPSYFPKLETVYVNFTQTERMEYRDASIVKVNDLFNKLLLSPLKVISVQVDEVDVRKFFNFMLTLNHFGKTLHTLVMKVWRMDAEIEIDVKNQLRDWISQLKFPKLSCLHLDCYVGPLEFLMKMPSLRKLSIATSSLEPLQGSNVAGLKFSLEKEEMLKPSMWKLFPELEWFQMDSAVYQQEGILDGTPFYSRIPLHRRIFITRQCYEKHQRIIN